MSARDNVIALPINSADRTNLADSTTNFTISLTKSLRNVTAIEVSNVVIPRTEANININNNKLSGAVIVDGIKTAFAVTLNDGNYTGSTLATEVQTQLNASAVMMSYPLVWSVSYSAMTQKMTISVTYGAGAAHTWAVKLDHTALIDVLGIGNASTVAHTYTAAPAATVLNIPVGRVTVIVRGLAYNITSARLTDHINTSYVRSLGKEFEVGPGNNSLTISATVVIGGVPTPSTVTVSLPTKSYTVIDATETLGELLVNALGIGSGYNVSFDNVKTVTIVPYFVGPISSVVFTVSPTSTLSMIRWPSTTPAARQVSAPVNLSINNDLLKSVVVHSTNPDDVIVDTSRDPTYRKYPAGYTIGPDDVIDIQLRNDRDHVVDLRGANWIMTVFVTIRA